MSSLPDKEKAFFEWYNEVLERSFMTDKRYPVKGSNVWTPFGFSVLRQMDRLIREKVEPLGYQETIFPTLIPETEMQKEAKHIKGFNEEVYWVTHGGKTQLDVRLALRPTSETAMYPMFALWVRSHKDLPLRVYQIQNVFRYETKTTRPFIRVREIHFYEGHTVQLGEPEADAQVKADLDSFNAITRALCLPHLTDKRPEWDKFPGAYYSIACEYLVGGNKTLQIGTVHHYKDNFAKPFGIGYEDKDGARQSPHQTTYGISERLLGAVVACHGDERGLVWPSAVAPIQVVIIPIPKESDMASVLAYSEDVRQKLSSGGFRVALDSSDERPGAKYYAWELKGVPLRLEIGPREMNENAVTVVNRLKDKAKISCEDLCGNVRKELEKFDTALLAKATAAFHGRLRITMEQNELSDNIVSLVGWCGSEECGKKVEEGREVSLLGTLEDFGPLSDRGGNPPPCIMCSNETTQWAVVGRPL
jgi:prolyl-tRNA synthetase